MGKKSKVDVIDLTQSTEVLSFSVGAGQECIIVCIAYGTCCFKRSIEVRLEGQDAKATIVGLLKLEGDSHVTLHSVQLHSAPKTTSNLLIKSVLTDQAKFYYEGAIRVQRQAQQTDAYQRNENLLLGTDGHAESKPILEILANDVRCTHGATIGSVREDEVWYLRSRGIPRETAETLIARGFLRSAVERLPLEYQERILSESGIFFT